MGKRKSAKQERAVDVELEDVKVSCWREKIDETMWTSLCTHRTRQSANLGPSIRRSSRTKCGSLSNGYAEDVTVRH